MDNKKQILLNSSTILKEIESVFQSIELNSLDKILLLITTSRNVITCGAGRMGLVAQTFSMRLVQLGLRSFSTRDSNVPHVDKSDLLIVASGSGETDSILTLVKKANENSCKIVLFTSRNSSSIAKLVNYSIILPAPSKYSKSKISTIQPMTTLMEQSTQIFLDAIVLQLMKIRSKTNYQMWKNHSNLE